AHTITAIIITHHTGAGTRTSATRMRLIAPTVHVTPCSNNAVAAPGSNASQLPTRLAANVITPIGASTATIGTLNIFAGRANGVARWKYTAIGSTITDSTTNPSIASSAVHSAI